MIDRNRFRIIMAFAAVYIIWGSTYLGIRFAIETMPPLLMTSLRFLAGGLALYGLMRWRGVPAPSRSHWASSAILGLLMPAGGTGLVAWAEQTVPSGLTALLVAAVPLWVVLADWLRPNGTKPTRLVVIGLVLGFLGVALLVNPVNIGGFRDVDVIGALMVILASMLWAAGSIYSRQARQPDSKLMAVSLQMITGGAFLLMVSSVLGEYQLFELAAVSIKSWLSLVYLIIAGSVAFAAYVWLLSVAGPARAATYAYVNPVIALMLGAVAAGETLSLWTLGCSFIVITAVAIIISSRRRGSSEPEAGSISQPCSPAPCPRS